jgi:hypothetical protein
MGRNNYDIKIEQLGLIRPDNLIYRHGQYVSSTTVQY